MLRERGKNTWQIVVYLGADADTGREIRQRETFHGTKRQAQDRERQLILDARDGRHHVADHTVKELLTEWLAHVEGDLSVTTVYNYRALIEQRIVPELGRVKLSKLTAARIDRFYRALRAELAPKTVRNVHAILRRALAQGQKWGWITTNPAALASPPKVTTAEIRPPARADVAAFLARTIGTDPQFGTLCWLAAVTGARRGELAGLRWTDIDIDTGAMLVERSVAQIGGQAIVKDTKTHQARRIAVDATTITLLEAQRARLVDLADAAHVTFTTDMPVFPNPQFEHLHPDTISKRYRAATVEHRDATAKELAEELDIPLEEALGQVAELGRLHDLRHFAVTQALAAGIPVRTVAGRVGHADPSVTLRVYGHFLEASDRVAADVLGALAAGT